HAGISPQASRERPRKFVIHMPAMAGFDEVETPLAEERQAVEWGDRADSETSYDKGVIDVPVAVFSATETEAAGHPLDVRDVEFQRARFGCDDFVCLRDFGEVPEEAEQIQDEAPI